MSHLIYMTKPSCVPTAISANDNTLFHLAVKRLFEVVGRHRAFIYCPVTANPRLGCFPSMIPPGRGNTILSPATCLQPGRFASRQPNPPTSPRMAAKRCLGTATSANWKTICRVWHAIRPNVNAAAISAGLGLLRDSPIFLWRVLLRGFYVVPFGGSNCFMIIGPLSRRRQRTRHNQRIVPG